MCLIAAFAFSLAPFFSYSCLETETTQLRFTSPWMLDVSGVDVYIGASGIDSL